MFSFTVKLSPGIPILTLELWLAIPTLLRRQVDANCDVGSAMEHLGPVGVWERLLPAALGFGQEIDIGLHAVVDRE